LWEDYVNNFDDVCGVGRDFIVTLKPQTREDALNKVFTKCRVVQNRTGIVTRGHYKNKEVRYFPNGKAVNQGIQRTSGRTTVS
jgi:hypothetical protein